MDFVQVFAGDDNFFRIDHYTMMQNRKPCVVLFENNNFKQVVLEA